MSWGAVAIAGATVIGGMMSAQQRASAQSAANRANMAMSAEELAQQKEQFGQGVTIGEERARSKREYAGGYLDPYSQTGQAALGQQSALLGLGTPEERETAMAGFSDSPGQRFMRERAEKSLLRNQAKIGGLGGGRVREALVEQGVGFAAQNYQNYLRNLQNVSGQGLVAGQTLTGADVGVSETALGLNEANQAAAAKAAAAKAEEERRKRMMAGRMTRGWTGGDNSVDVGGTVSGDAGSPAGGIGDTAAV